MTYANNCPGREGFLDTPIIKAANITPIPRAAPIRPIVAKPLSIIFAGCIIFYVTWFAKK